MVDLVNALPLELLGDTHNLTVLGRGVGCGLFETLVTAMISKRISYDENFALDRCHCSNRVLRKHRL